MNKINTPSTIEDSLHASFKSLSKGISLCVIGIGCLVFIGWALDIDALKTIVPGIASMKSNSAVLFVLSGISLWMQAKGPTRRVAQALGLIVAFAGLMTLGEYVFNGDFGIDQLLFRDATLGALYPGRMAPATALTFLLIGLCLVFLDTQKNRFNEFLAIAVFAISMLALIGYIYGVSTLYQIGVYSSMALHTALSFFLLSIAILFARPEKELIQTILADSPGGNILRRLLPIAIGTPILLGWLGLLGQRAGLYNETFGLALIVIALSTILVILIWITAGQLTEMDFERQKIHHTLQESEIHFRNTLEDMMEGCQIIGYDWRYLYINKTAEKHNRRPNSELIGNVYMDMWPGIETTAVFPLLRSCMETRIPERMLHEFTYPNGSVGWFELSIQPVPDGIFILSSDVTDGKRAEREIRKLNTELEGKVAERTATLAQANALLQTMMDNIPDHIFFKDREGRFIRNSKSQTEMLGLSDPIQAIGKTDFDFFPHAQRSFDEEQEVIRSGKPLIGIEESVAWPDGHKTWLSTTKVPLRDQNGQIIGTFGIGRDITDHKYAEDALQKAKDELEIKVAERTIELRKANDQLQLELQERKQAEAALRESEEKFSVAFHSSPISLFISTVDGKLVEVNWAFCELIGYSEEEIIGNTVVGLRLFSAHDRETLMTFLKSADGSVRNFEAQIRVQNGGLRDILYSLETISFRGELHRLSTGVDITERKQAEREILKLNAELEGKVAERTAALGATNEQLRQISLFDALTGLYNRRGFLLLAEQQLSLARRTKRNLLAFYADLDGLKQINDHFGHNAGDEAIVTIAHALNETFRTSDIKARLGGDEFIVLVVEAEEHSAQILLARLRERLAEKNQAMSVGMVICDANNDISIDDLIARADEAMYAEKRDKPGYRES